MSQVNTITVKEAAEVLNVSTRQVNRLINAGKIQAEKVKGSWVITPTPPAFPNTVAPEVEEIEPVNEAPVPTPTPPEAPTTDGELITIQQAAVQTGYSPVRVHRLISEGRIVGAVRVGKRKWGIPSPVVVLNSLGQKELLERTEGHSMRACGNDCAAATEENCHCICGGKNHGSAVEKAAGAANQTQEQVASDAS